MAILKIVENEEIKKSRLDTDNWRSISDDFDLYLDDIMLDCVRSLTIDMSPGKPVIVNLEILATPIIEKDGIIVEVVENEHERKD